MSVSDVINAFVKPFQEIQYGGLGADSTEKPIKESVKYGWIHLQHTRILVAFLTRTLL